MSAGADKQLIHAPESTANAIITDLAYVEAVDEYTNQVYAFLAYKEEKPVQKRWLFVIKANRTATSTINPDDPLVRKLISQAAKANRPYALIGINMLPREDDCRTLENRLYFDESLKPKEVEIYVRLRSKDGSPGEVKSARFPWPADSQLFFSEKRRLLTPPHSSLQVKITPLGYMTSYDVIDDKDYAFLAYLEERQDARQWMIRIKATETPDVTINPEHPALRHKLLAAAELGQPFIVYGYQLTPTPGDQRLIETRIYLGEDQKPGLVEVRLVTRHVDNTPRPEKKITFAWPK